MTGQVNAFLDDLIKNSPKKAKKQTKRAVSPITKETRLESYLKTDKRPLKEKVLATLGRRELTAQEIATEMHKNGMLPYPARAIIQPRITELVDRGLVEVTGKKLDATTDRIVAVYKAVQSV